MAQFLSTAPTYIFGRDHDECVAALNIYFIHNPKLHKTVMIKGVKHSEIILSKGRRLYLPFEFIKIGTEIYCMGEKLGAGVYGKVLFARNIISGKNVAIKVQEVTNVERVNLQCQLTAKFGIGAGFGENAEIKIQSRKHNATKSYMVLRLASGSFEDYLKSFHRRDLSSLYASLRPYITDFRQIRRIHILTILHEICHQMIDMHAAGYAHLDMKPDNVLMVEESPFISDFGLSYPIGKSVRKYRSKEHSGHIAPERYNAKDEKDGIIMISKELDYWSFGAMLERITLYYRPMHDLMPIARRLREINPSRRMSLESAGEQIEALIKRHFKMEAYMANSIVR